MTLLIDSHVNLHHHSFDEDREAVIQRARDAGVGRMITICDKIENFPQVIAIAEAHADIYASVGAHPHYAKDHLDLTAEKLIELGRHPKIVGIGETGLDQHYGFSPFDDQVQVFRVHAAAARTLGKTLIIHTREADQAMGDLLEEEAGKGPLRILMHCYTSGAELARRAIKLGAYISFSGIMTFKNANDVRAENLNLVLKRAVFVVLIEAGFPYSNHPLVPPEVDQTLRGEIEVVFRIMRVCADAGVDVVVLFSDRDDLTEVVDLVADRDHAADAGFARPCDHRFAVFVEAMVMQVHVAIDQERHWRDAPARSNTPAARASAWRGSISKPSASLRNVSSADHASAHCSPPCSTPAARVHSPASSSTPASFSNGSPLILS